MLNQTTHSPVVLLQLHLSIDRLSVDEDFCPAQRGQSHLEISHALLICLLAVFIYEESVLRLNAQSIEHNLCGRHGVFVA